ncbi:MAG: FAD-binding oxidoreductase [Jhaorihella sp.]
MNAVIDYAGPAPEPMSDIDVRAMAVGLAQVTSPDRVWHGAAAQRRYPGDMSWLTCVHAQYGRPLVRHEVAVRVASTREVSRVMKYASAMGIPVTPFGGGSGVQGAANSTCGGILLDLGGLNKVRHIDSTSVTCTVEAGKIIQPFEAELNAMGLSFPHYPASAEWASVGGSVAAKGAGVLSTKYGTMQDHVLSAEIVLANGDIVQMPSVPRHGAGPDLTQMFAGSEGTLGIITAVTVKLRPLPTQRRFLAIGFDNLAPGVEAGRRIMTEAAHPAVMRFYDKPAATQSLNKAVAADITGETMVIMYDGSHAALIDTETTLARQICEEQGGRMLDSGIGPQWWDNRYTFCHPPHAPELPQIWCTMDAVADYSHIMGVYDAVTRAVIDSVDPKWGLTVKTHFSHWFDWGAMIYPRVIIPKGPDDLGQALELHDAFVRAATMAALQAGGIMNGHHGLGMRLAPYLGDQFSPESMALMRTIKGALDPARLLCRGKLDMDEPG